jgi:hypothetical protein
LRLFLQQRQDRSFGAFFAKVSIKSQDVSRSQPNDARSKEKFCGRSSSVS